MALCIVGFLFTKKTQYSEYKKNIKKYSELLENDPNNCFYNEQIATNYQVLRNFNGAIKHYKIVIKNCPDNLISIFDLGICYYVTMERTLALEYMNKAIEEAIKANKKELESMFIKSKSEWLEKWDSIKELDWNKRKAVKHKS